MEGKWVAVVGRWVAVVGRWVAVIETWMAVMATWSVGKQPWTHRVTVTVRRKLVVKTKGQKDEQEIMNPN